MKTPKKLTMERYMLHLKNSGYDPKDAGNLLKRARIITNDLVVTIRDCRISSRYIEYDVTIEQDNFDNLLSLLKPIGSLDNSKHVIEEEIKKEDAIEEGIFYFNTERFWECHEVLEGVWKKCFEGEKDLVQGIILVAAGLVHYQKNEENVCFSIFQRALEKLTNSSGMYHKIDVEKLRLKVIEVLETRKISTFVI